MQAFWLDASWSSVIIILSFRLCWAPALWSHVAQAQQLFLHFPYLCERLIPVVNPYNALMNRKHGHPESNDDNKQCPHHCRSNDEKCAEGPIDEPQYHCEVADGLVPCLPECPSLLLLAPRLLFMRTSAYRRTMQARLQLKTVKYA